MKKKALDENLLLKWEAREKARIFIGWMRLASYYTFDRLAPTAHTKVAAIETLILTEQIEAIGKA